MAYTMLRGGRVLDIAAGTAEPADVLVEDDTIREIGAPGCPAPADAAEIAAARRLLHPGLVNAHTHGHGNLAKGLGDRWSLELLLSAAPIDTHGSIDTFLHRPVIAPIHCVMRSTVAASIPR